MELLLRVIGVNTQVCKQSFFKNNCTSVHLTTDTTGSPLDNDPRQKVTTSKGHKRSFLLLNIFAVAAHRHTHDGVAGGGVGLALGAGGVVVHEERDHLGHGGEGDVRHTVHLLDVHDGLVHLEREDGKKNVMAQTQRLRVCVGIWYQEDANMEE